MSAIFVLLFIVSPLLLLLPRWRRPAPGAMLARYVATLLADALRALRVSIDV